MVTGIIFRGYNGRSVILATHIHLVPLLSTSGATSPHAMYAFTAEHGQIYLRLWKQEYMPRGKLGTSLSALENNELCKLRRFTACPEMGPRRRGG
jgi:hypothetical protein